VLFSIATSKKKKKKELSFDNPTWDLLKLIEFRNRHGGKITKFPRRESLSHFDPLHPLTAPLVLSRAPQSRRILCRFLSHESWVGTLVLLMKAVAGTSKVGNWQTSVSGSRRELDVTRGIYNALTDAMLPTEAFSQPTYKDENPVPFKHPL
jgi:hypothetical protein